MEPLHKGILPRALVGTVLLFLAVLMCWTTWLFVHELTVPKPIFAVVDGLRRIFGLPWLLDAESRQWGPVYSNEVISWSLAGGLLWCTFGIFAKHTRRFVPALCFSIVLLPLAAILMFGVACSLVFLRPFGSLLYYGWPAVGFPVVFTIIVMLNGSNKSAAEDGRTLNPKP